MNAMVEDTPGDEGQINAMKIVNAGTKVVDPIRYFQAEVCGSPVKAMIDTGQKLLQSQRRFTTH